MFAAAVYPLLLGTLAPVTPRHATLRAGAGDRRWCGAVGMVSLMRGSLTDFRVRLWVPLATAAWLLVMPMHAPASNSHALVTLTATWGLYPLR